MFRFKMQHRFLLLLTMVVLTSMLAQAVFAWQVNVQYGHNNRFGGEADSGWHRGQIEMANGERRVRAGDDYVKWTAAQVNWWLANGNAKNRPAMVYHAFKDVNDNGCGDLRIVNVQWSWSNLPGWQPWTKSTCFAGPQNEIRFLIYGYQQLVANTPYYFQHLFKDQKWSDSGGTQRGKGKITTDTYHDRDHLLFGHEGVTQDYHGVFCVSNQDDLPRVC